MPQGYQEANFDLIKFYLWGIEWSLRALTNKRAVRLFSRARAVITFTLTARHGA